MKQMLLAISAVIVSMGLAYAQADGPVIDQRQANSSGGFGDGLHAWVSWGSVGR